MANADVTPNLGRKLGRGVLALLLLGAVGVGVWALLRFVVADERLLLDYVRVLIWPLVVGMVLYWLRAPLREKFGQLLSVEGFGASAQFSAEAQAQRLTHDLTPDLSALFERDPASDETDEESSDSDSGASEEEPEPEEVAPEEPDAKEPPETTPGEPDPATLPVTSEQVVELARAIGTPKATLDRMQQDMAEAPEAVAGVLAFLSKAARDARHQRNVAVHNTKQSRDRIEGVIRNSAAWGYDMGRAGAPKTVPDVEWSDDGSWKITTEVPAPKPRRTQEDRTPDIRGAERVRQVKALEDEIKKLERDKHNPLRVSMATMGNESWLRELKERLRAIDPTNPWT